MIRRWPWKIAIFFVCICLAGTLPLNSQSAKPETAEITGRVLLADGSALPGAIVTLTGTRVGLSLKAVSQEGGVFRFPGLPAGTYDLKAEAPGFIPASNSAVTIAAGQSQVVDFKLTPAAIREAITVIGTAPRTSLESTDVRQSSARDVGEALSSTTGVWKVRKGGIANDIVVRGFRSKDLNVLVDGERIYGACPNHMDPPAFHADFSEVDRVEISKGPYDMRHQGSMVGTVNIVTRKPEPGWNARANFSGGAYGFVNPALAASYGSDRFSALAGFSYRSSSPYEDGANRSFVELGNYLPRAKTNDAFRVWTAWGRMSYEPGKNQLIQVAYTRQQADHVQYPYLLMDAVYDNTDRAQIGYRIDRRLGPMDWLHFQTYLTGVDHWMTDRDRTSSLNMARDYSMGTRAKSRSLGGTLEAGIGKLVLGLEAFRRKWDAQTLMAAMGYKAQASIPGVNTDSLGFYGIYTMDLSKRLRLDLGGRVDAARMDADSSIANTNLYFAYNSTRSTRSRDVYPSGSLHLTYKASEGLDFNVGLGHAVRLPDAVERYYGLQRKGTDWVGNPGLKPSRNTGFDAGVAARYRGLFVRANVFLDYVGDYIQVVDRAKLNPIAGIMNTNARSYGNINARLYGGELEAVYPLTRRFTFSTDLSYVRGTQKPNASAEGIRSSNLSEIPPLRLRTKLRYDAGRLFAEIEGVASAAQDFINADLLEARTPAYAIANFLAGMDFGSFAVQLVISNILDSLYYENLSFQRDPFRSGTRVYEPGANVYLNVSYRLGSR